MSLRGRYCFVFVIFIVLISSCSSRLNIVKRKYEQGFYVDFCGTNKQHPLVLHETHKDTSYFTACNNEKDKNETNNDSTLISAYVLESENREDILIGLNSFNKKQIIINSNFHKQSFLSDTLMHIDNQAKKWERHKKIKKIEKSILIIIKYVLVFIFICILTYYGWMG